MREIITKKDIDTTLYLTLLLFIIYDNSAVIYYYSYTTISLTRITIHLRKT